MSKKYSIVELFPTIQGEGRWAGRTAVFLRFAGCNMWNGRPEDRAIGAGACAMWCDTYFAKGDAMPLPEIVTRLEAAWGEDKDSRMVVITGGEPTLQIDLNLIKALKHEGWFVAVETNGTNYVEALDIVDHVCVSPKRGSYLQVFQAEELKVVLPGGVPGAPPEMQWDEGELLALESQGQWGSLYVQPQDATDPTQVEVTALKARVAGHEVGRAASIIYDRNLAACIDWVRKHPRWKLSLQQHKYLGLR